ncbi:MAG: molybdopterin-synthase adenylyltransferase MoeB [Endomicrobium sp.]|jgi:adenylyltransferase/sulfurtransferase|nr:molybdopterin-synthase adenylyltransferase MoeB [Endomicrobium sp.]
MGIISNERIKDLTHEEAARYERHIVLPEIGIEGQKKLKASRVLIVGAGGLGAPVALYLAAAGAGVIGIADFDRVETSNLQRQVIYGLNDAGKLKTQAASRRIKELNPFVEVKTYDVKLSADNAVKILKDYDIVADCSDNFASRYLINDVCALLGIADVYGSVLGFEGQAGVFYAKNRPCYRCMHPLAPPSASVPSCSQEGVLGALCAVTGGIQACEIIKFICQSGESLAGRLLSYNVLTMKFKEFKIEKDPKCVLCGSNPSLKSLEDIADYDYFCNENASADAAEEEQVLTLTPKELKSLMEKDEYLNIIDIRYPYERAVFEFPNAKIIPFEKLICSINELNPSKKTVLICKIGKRSIAAIQELKKAGYKGKVYNLKGGAAAWINEVEICR